MGQDSPWRRPTAGPPAAAEAERAGAPRRPAPPASQPAGPAAPAAWPGCRGSPRAAAAPPAAPAACPASAPCGGGTRWSAPAARGPSPPACHTSPLPGALALLHALDLRLQLLHPLLLAAHSLSGSRQLLLDRRQAAGETRQMALSCAAGRRRPPPAARPHSRVLDALEGQLVQLQLPRRQALCLLQQALIEGRGRRHLGAVPAGIQQGSAACPPCAWQSGCGARGRTCGSG